MTLSKYQQLAERTLADDLRDDHSSRIGHAIYGLLAEAGEVAGVLQKYERGDYSYDEAMSKLHDELGDVQWYLAETSSAHGWSLDDIAADNLDKLQARAERGAIRGGNRDD